MQKIKNISYTIAAMFLVAPLVVSAQGVVIPQNVGEVVIPQNAGPTGTITDILQNFMYWLLMIVGILGVISFVISGIMYLTSAGDEKQIERAKKTLIYSIIGVIVAMLGVIVLQAVKSLLSGESSNF
jgi:cytochrome bd-type quinol oxidase subunit 2